MRLEFSYVAEASMESESKHNGAYSFIADMSSWHSGFSRGVVFVWSTADLKSEMLAAEVHHPESGRDF